MTLKWCCYLSNKAEQELWSQFRKQVSRNFTIYLSITIALNVGNLTNCRTITQQFSLMADSSSTHPLKYDVFLSFSGADTRNNFTGHLYVALAQKSIITFMDNNDLNVGEEISLSILNAIEESKIAVVVFSKKYVYSTWCLDEIVKIMECRETRGQLVMPIFYGIKPSKVMKVFAEAHDQDFINQFQKWKHALTKATSLTGWYSNKNRSEAELVDKIVSYISLNLRNAHPSHVEGLVGINSRIEEIEKLLSDVRILGIWGMGGVGKTTLAEAVFNQIACRFKRCCFLANVREESEKCGGLTRLQEQILSKILVEKELKSNGTPNIEYSFAVQRMLSDKMVLIVVDDVNSLQQLDLLVGNHYRFGSGSRIIVTSRDKQVLKNFVDYTYEVQELAHHEALQLFNQNAFKKQYPLEDYNSLSHSVVEYAKGVPLALKVLGASLFGKSKREWSSALEKLKKAPHRDIQNVLKIGYDDLDSEEKNIFLDIACFFRGDNVDMVTKILDGCGFSTDIALSVLVDKSLINISENKIEMHDLLQEMGKAIVREESKEPGKRSRLWNHEDIRLVLTKDMGTEVIEGISLDISKINKIHLNPNAFQRMHNLRLLKFYKSDSCGDSEEDIKVHLSRSLRYLSDELRFLYWYACPLKSLPADFDQRNLVYLKLPHSKVECLWKGEKDLDKLTEIDLSCSQNLTKIPELSKARNLACMKLSGCKNIRSLPSTIHLSSLKILDLNDCSKLKKFPETSRNITSLYLSRTAIEKVPSSIASLSGLRLLEMDHCTKLKSLPGSICKLKNLTSLSLHGCTKLQKFPEISETMHCLKVLVLNGTAIKELPSSIDRLKGLSSIYLENCRNLAHLPESFCNLKALYWLFLTCCPKLKILPEKLLDLTILEDLTASGCNLLKVPSDLNKLSCISKLDLSRNNFEKLPVSIKQLSHLQWLDVSFCERLQSLPELPPSITDIDAHSCRSLETISGLGHIFQLKYTHTFYRKKFVFSNCIKLDQSAWSNFLVEAQLWIQKVAIRAYNEESFSIWYPGSKIPKWFTNRSEGSSIRIQMPPYSQKFRLLGFSLCVVLAFEDGFEYHNSFFDVLCIYRFKNIRGECSNYREFYSSRTHVSGSEKHVGSDHVIIFYDPNFSATKANELSYNEASFEFYWQTNHEGHYMQSCKVKKCAVLPLYAQEEECCNGMESPTEIRMNPVDDASKHKRYWVKSESCDEAEEKMYVKKLKLDNTRHI